MPGAPIGHAASPIRWVSVAPAMQSAGIGGADSVSVLPFTAALGLPDLCGRLIKAGADIHATDAQGLITEMVEADLVRHRKN